MAKQEFMIVDLGHGITLSMPRNPEAANVIYALLFLGGLLWSGFGAEGGDEKKWRRMVDDMFNDIKTHDFSDLAKECVVYGDAPADPSHSA